MYAAYHSVDFSIKIWYHFFCIYYKSNYTEVLLWHGMMKQFFITYIPSA